MLREGQKDDSKICTCIFCSVVVGPVCVYVKFDLIYDFVSVKA